MARCVPCDAGRAFELFDRVEPIESYPVPGGQMVRYRASLGGHVAHYLFGWTDDDKIFWTTS